MIIGFLSSIFFGFFSFLKSVIHVILAGASTGVAFYLGRVLDRLIVEDIGSVKNMRKLLLEFQRYFKEEEASHWKIKKIREYMDSIWTLKEGLLFRYHLLDQSIEKTNLLIDKFSELSNDSQLMVGLVCLWELDAIGHSKRLQAMLAYFEKNFVSRLFISFRRYVSKLSRKSVDTSMYCSCLKTIRNCRCVKVCEDNVLEIESLLR